MALLEVSGLVSRYGRDQSLKGVDITVAEGELVALVGANGAGKTTLLRTISGVQPAAEGTITYRGERIDTVPADLRVRRGLVQVPEGRQVFGPLSVEDNLRLGAYHRSGDVREDIEQVYMMFPILEQKRKLPAGSLSGGQQQMLAMGRALMSKPTLLLLDEPTMGLSPLLVQQIFEVIQNLKKAGRTILLVEQNAHLALGIADRGYVLETGSVVAEGPGKELAEDPRVKEAYLGAA